MATETNTAKYKHARNAEIYDIMKVYLKKGQRDQLREACKRAGVSMNSVFAKAAERFIEEHSLND